MNRIRKVRIPYVNLSEQFQKEKKALIKEIERVLSSGKYILSEEVEKFEKGVCDYLKVKYCVGVNSGTDAIKLSLKALDVKAGDEVITSANTFVATVGAINEIGAKTVFVDCDDKFCMNVDQVESKITSKTKAVVPVHFSGYMTDMPKLMNICDKNNIHVVEDACQSILAEINNKLSGTWGETGCFSLHPLKNINVWSDGGIIITNNENIYEKIKLLNIQKDMMIKQMIQFPNLYYAKSHFPLEISQRAFDHIWRMCESYELWCKETKQTELIILNIID